MGASERHQNRFLLMLDDFLMNTLETMPLNICKIDDDFYILSREDLLKKGKLLLSFKLRRIVSIKFYMSTACIINFAQNTLLIFM